MADGVQRKEYGGGECYSTESGKTLAFLLPAMIHTINV